MQREDVIRLTHMLEAARNAVEFCRGHSAQTLEADHMRALAVVKSIEIVGEASTKVSDEVVASAKAIDWRGVRRMRNRLIHGYDTIDIQLVWTTVELDLPPLIKTLDAILREYPRLS